MVGPQEFDALLGGLVAGLLVGLVLAPRLARRWHRRLAVVVACAHLGATIGVTLFPLGAGVVYEGQSNISLVPGRTILQLIDGSQSRRQLGGNVALLAPMGILVPIAFERARPWLRTLGWGVVVAVLIELGQLALNQFGLAHRVIDIDDVLLNVAGVAIGRMVFAIGWPIWRWLTGSGRPHGQPVHEPGRSVDEVDPGKVRGDD